jgi:uncharacterized membrane protein YccC
MSNASDIKQPGALASALQAWAREELPKWEFIIRTIAAGLCALWIAYRLGFSSPGTAITTVFIVSVPQSGQVLAKSFYRAIGTLVGAAVAVALVGTLAQERNLFLFLMAAWLGVCTFGAAYFRGFQAYAFVLSGYTAGIIALPALADVPQVFDIALFRVSEVLLGILCAGVFADLLFPRRTSDLILKAVRGGFAEFIDYLQSARDGSRTRAQLQQANFGFITEAVQFELLRESSYFENPEVRVRSARLRLFNAEFMGATTAFHGYFAMIGRVRRRGDDALADHFGLIGNDLLALLRVGGKAPASAAEARQALGRLLAFRETLPARYAAAKAIVASQENADERVIRFDTIARQFDRFIIQLTQYTEAYASLETLRGNLPHPAPTFAPHTETLGAVLMGLRAFLTVIIVAAFWVATAWPAGSGAVLIAGVVCALFAAAPRAEVAARNLLIGFALAIPFAAVVHLAVLPRLDGFGLFCAGVLPFLMASTYAMATPSVAAVGLGFNLNFLVLVGFSNSMVYDAPGLFNNGIAQLLGGLVGLLMLTVALPTRPLWITERMRAALRRHAAEACYDGLPGLRSRFESRTRDLLVQLISIAAQTPEQHRVQLAQALAVLDLGDAVIHLRRAARDADMRAVETLPTLQSIEKLLLEPTPEHRDAARRKVRDALGRLRDERRARGDTDDTHPRWRLHTNLVRILGIVADDTWFADLNLSPADVPAGVPANAA